MWGVIPIQIRRNPSISPKSKLLYCEITDCMNDKMECRTTNEEFAEYLSYSVPSVKIYINELKDLELICVEVSGNERIISLPERLVIPEVKKKKKESAKLKRDLTEQIVNIWNEGVLNGDRDRGITAGPKLIGTVTARSKDNSDEDILTAVKKRVEMVNNSEWHNKKENIHHKKNIYLVLRTDQELKKHLYMEVNKKEENSINMVRF